MKGPFSSLRIVGSLRFAAVLLVLLLVAMGCATVFESVHGTEQALARFYSAWWFELLLWLLAVNVAAAALVRYPFTKAQIGFVITHASILLVLVGALVTKHWAVEGQVGLREGQTVAQFHDRHNSTLTIRSRLDRTEASMNLAGTGVDSLAAIDNVRAPALRFGDARVELLHYLPDSAAKREVVNDNPRPLSAVQVSLSLDSDGEPTWLFAEHSLRLGMLSASYHEVKSPEELDRLLTTEPATADGSKGTVRIELAGNTYVFAIEECMENPVALSGSDWTVQVLRYLPHAIVGSDRQVTSASDRPVNPAIEVELTGPDGVERRFAFSRFPEFSAMHGDEESQAVNVFFLTGHEEAPPAAIQILRAVNDRLLVRFNRTQEQPAAQELILGQPVETPWQGQALTVHQRYDHARVAWSVEPVEPIRTDRQPALMAKLSTQNDSSEMWLQKNVPQALTIDGVPYEIVYGSRQVPLGFELTLNRFQIGRYPGETRPRSFESQITMLDPRTGRELSRVVSMNQPVKHAGFSMYQSSYREEGETSWSFLSVSRDPGKPIVFAGYILLMVGMLVVLATRMRAARRMAKVSEQ